MSKLKVFIVSQIIIGLTAFGILTNKTELPQPSLIQLAAPNLPIVPIKPVDPELIDVQIPLPKSERIFNRSGSQCVWCTIEMLGKWNHVSKLDGLTQKYKHATGPAEVKMVLDKLGVKFKQTIRKDEDMLEEYVANKKFGCGVGVHGTHVILVCHFDKIGNVIKVIDNSDKDLKIQTLNLDQFRKKWSDWTFVIFPENYCETLIVYRMLNNRYLVWWKSSI